jgi:3-hydroxybutyryl-CoA dehydratase
MAFNCGYLVPRNQPMAFSSIHLFFDDVNVGQEFESAGRTVTEADIVNFAGISGDYNPIHVDHEFARTTHFRQPMAHGMLVWAISSGLGSYAPPMRTMAFLSVRDWEFKHPVYIGDTIRLISKVFKKEERSKGRRGVITWHRKVINQDDKIVHEGFTVTLVEGRANLNRGAVREAKVLTDVAAE